MTVFPAAASGDLSVIVPVYNEETTISIILEKLLQLEALKEIIVVDDCSKDRTYAVASEFASRHPEIIKILRHAKNAGKTEGLKTGFAASTGSIVIVQDADLEYDPSEIIDVITPIRNGVADVVFGSRFLVKKASRVLYFYHYLANKLLTTLSNVLTNLNMTDVETGYKAFRGEIIRGMRITSTGFGFEIEVTAKVAKLHCAIYEVPISYYGRTYEEGKKIGTKDGIDALWYLLKYNVFTSLQASYSVIPSMFADGHPAAPVTHAR